MNIKTNSWHYAWYEYFLREAVVEIKQPNLCKYFWVVVIGAPMLWTVLLFGKFINLIGRVFKRIPSAPNIPDSVVAVSGWVATVLAIGVGLLIIGIIGVVIYQNLIVSLIVVGTIVGSLLGATIVILLLMFFVSTKEERRKKTGGIREPRKPPEIPGTIKLIWSFVWAKKEKVCPFITFDTVEERNQ